MTVKLKFLAAVPEAAEVPLSIPAPLFNPFNILQTSSVTCFLKVICSVCYSMAAVACLVEWLFAVLLRGFYDAHCRSDIITLT